MASKPRLMVATKLVRCVIVVDENSTHEEKWAVADEAMMKYVIDHAYQAPLFKADGIDKFKFLPIGWDEDCVPYGEVNFFEKPKTIKEILLEEDEEN